MADTQKVTEIERAALTNLYNFKNMILDEALAAYVNDLGTNQDYCEIKNDLHPEQRVKIYDAETDDAARRGYKMAGRAIWALACGVAIYRINGRVDGDRITTIDRMAGFTVTTSLAAYVAQFTKDIVLAHVVQYS